MGRGRSEKTLAIVEQARELLEAEHPMTLRQCFYRLVSVESMPRAKMSVPAVTRVD